MACALTRWRRLGPVSAIPALLASELPFIVGYWLIAWTVLALVDGDLDSPSGAASAASAPILLNFHGGGFYSGSKAVGQFTARVG